MSTTTGSVKLIAARRRAARAKVFIAGAGVIAFGAAFALTRTSHASHIKHQPRALAAPSSFVDSVRSDLLRGGSVAPPQAPPPVETSTS